MRTTFTYLAIVATMSVAGAGVSRTYAQADKREHDCKMATRIVEKGKPVKKEEWAWATVLGCGAAGGVAAHDAWLQVRTETDTSQLEGLYSRLWSFRDASLFDAAQSVFADASASPQSRVYSAMLLLVQLFDDRNPAYRYFISTGTYGVCRIAIVYDRTIYPGSALPSDARQRVRLAAQSVLSNASAPVIVQSAARCVDQEIMLDDRIQASKPIIPPGW